MSAKGVKQLKDKHQAILNDLLREEANRYCADCRAKGPRWASWNLGVFLCIRCAGIHRNLGVHISRVKSVNLDSWTPEQMESIQKWGNGRAADYYECFLPQDFIRPHGDSAMETLIRNKYERKLYLKKDGEPPLRNDKQAISKPSQEKKREKSAEPKSNASQAKKPEMKIEKKVVQSNPVAVQQAQRNITTVQKPQPPPIVDLLGMDNPSPTPAQQPLPAAATQNGNNEFDLFMQAAPASATPQSQAGPVSQTQMNAFPQTSMATGESLMLEDKNPAPANTKASIMSLYQSGNQQQKSIYGVPGGLYVSQPSAMNTQMMTGMGQKQPAMVMSQSGMGVSRPQMMMNRPSMGISQPNMNAGHPSMGMSQPNMVYSQNQAMMMSGMSQSHQMSPNMMAMQNQMQNQMQSMNMGPRMNPMQMPRQQYMTGSFQASLGQSIMANSYGPNRPMMPAQQPILVNGPTSGLSNVNMNASQAMGHTLSNQLWK